MPTFRSKRGKRGKRVSYPIVSRAQQQISGIPYREGLMDTYRSMYPQKVDSYSGFSVGDTVRFKRSSRTVERFWGAIAGRIIEIRVGRTGPLVISASTATHIGPRGAVAAIKAFDGSLHFSELSDLKKVPLGGVKMFSVKVPVGLKPKERRGVLVHGREFWLTEDEMRKEFPDLTETEKRDAWWIAKRGVLYICEDCGHKIPEGQEVRLEDGDTILCRSCATKRGVKATLNPKDGYRDFKSREAYRKHLAWGHMRTKTGLLVRAKKGRKSAFEATPGHQKVRIRGEVHKVKH